MRQFILWFTKCCLLLSTTTAGVEQTKEYLISYVEHQGIIHYYVPLLKRAYQKIGIEPTFVLVNDQRALRLLNLGQLDADTAKTAESLGNYPNIIYLPTPISKIEILFICQPTIQCDRSVLKDSSKNLAVIGAHEFYQTLLASSVIKLVELTSFDILFKMFDQQKVDVALVVFDAYSRSKLNKYPNHYKITEKLGYHLLNKSHQALVPKLEMAIKQVLAEGDFYLPISD